MKKLYRKVCEWLFSIYRKIRYGGFSRCNCWYCGHEIIWGCDYDYSDVYGEGEGIVSQLSCPHCGAFIEYTLRLDEDEEVKVDNNVEIKMEDFEDKK